MITDHFSGDQERRDSKQMEAVCGDGCSDEETIEHVDCQKQRLIVEAKLSTGDDRHPRHQLRAMCLPHLSTEQSYHHQHSLADLRPEAGGATPFLHIPLPFYSFHPLMTFLLSLSHILSLPLPLLFPPPSPSLPLFSLPFHHLPSSTSSLTHPLHLAKGSGER